MTDPVVLGRVHVGVTLLAGDQYRPVGAPVRGIEREGGGVGWWWMECVLDKAFICASAAAISFSLFLHFALRF